MRKLLAPDLPIIDDFGLSAKNMPHSEEFYEIIAERHQCYQFKPANNDAPPEKPKEENKTLAPGRKINLALDIQPCG